MESEGVDVLMLSVGSDLPYFCGYEAMPLERITMLVVPRDGDATLVLPGLEAARVTERPELFSLRGWGETEDPIAIIADLAGPAAEVAIGDHMWAGFLVDLTRQMPNAAFRRASTITSPIRQVKDGQEVEEVSFVDCTIWGELGDNIAASLNKGDRVIAMGRLHQSSWESPTGEKRSKLELVVDEMSPSLRWATVSVSKSGGNAQAPQQAPQQAAKPSYTYNEEPF